MSRLDISENFSEFSDRLEKLSFLETKNFSRFSVGFTGTRKVKNKSDLLRYIA